jgi:fructokinase
MFVVCGEALYDVFMRPGGGGDGRFVCEGVPGGSPFNVAVGLARMGVATGFLCGLSQDVLGEALAQRLASEGVSPAYLVRKQDRTTLSLVGLGPEGTPAYTFYGDRSADFSLREEELPEFGPEVLGLHLGSYATVVQPTGRALATLAAREQHRFISYDPNIRLNVEPDRDVWKQRIAALLPLTALLKVSDEDIALLWPGHDPEAVAADMARHGPALVVLTRGSAGAVAFAGERRISVSAAAITVVDTVGAGDAFQAQLIAALLADGALSRAALAAMADAAIHALVARASLAAAITCQRRGADPPTAVEMADALGPPA